MPEVILGTTKITNGWKITLLQDIREILDANKKSNIKVGDKIVYYQNEKGDVVIRRAK